MIWLILILTPSILGAILITHKKPQIKTILKKGNRFVITSDFESTFLN